MIRSSDPDIIRPYLEDASNLAGGFANEVVFPENEKDVSQILAEASAKKIPVTVAGNGTGLTGARIPFGGIVLSTEKLGGIQEVDMTKRYAVAGAGTTLRQLQESVNEKGFLYPPDPTEQNAFIGASVSTNASGARSFKYGATRRWIRRLKVVLSDGSVLDIQRGQRPFLRFEKEKKGAVPLVPTYRTPPIKNAAGYYVDDRLDPVDLFIGAEGTLGVVTVVEVDLIPKPE
ncbi:MAG: FAD-binding oxidoreductase [Candidatus Omnitrophica bacterium]|nr:FAD-binding oxidoreductase [Candidatus Omnitrophota bacterium]